MGAIEHERFFQTLQTFDTKKPEVVDIPKAMNNLSVSKVLDLWNERVVAHTEEPNRPALEKQKK